MKSLRICHVGNGLVKVDRRSAGGIERYIHELASTQALIHSVFVVDGDFPGVEESGSSYHRIRAPSRNTGSAPLNRAFSQVTFVLRSWPVIRALLALEGIEIVNLHHQFTGGMLTARILSLGIPVIYTVHNRLWSGSRIRGMNRLVYALDRIAIRRATRVIALNAAMLHSLGEYLGAERRKVAVAPVGVNVDLFRPKVAEIRYPSRGVRILCVARISEEKNQLQLIRALSIVIASGATARLELVGPIDSRSYFRILRDEVARLALEETVDLVGRVSTEELISLYQDSDLFVMPSLIEGQSQAVLEALACGLPVLLSDIPAHKEFGESGIAKLVDFSDVETVAVEIGRMANGESPPNLLRRRDYVIRNHGWDVVGKRVDQVYRGALLMGA